MGVLFQPIHQLPLINRSHASTQLALLRAPLNQYEGLICILRITCAAAWLCKPVCTNGGSRFTELSASLVRSRAWPARRVMKESLLKDHAESSRLVGESDGEYRPTVWLQLGPMRVTAPCFGRGLVIGTVVVCLIALPICIWELKEKQHAEDHIVAWFVGGVFALLVRARWMLAAGPCFQGLTPRVVRIVCVWMCVDVCGCCCCLAFVALGWRLRLLRRASSP